MSLNIEAIVIKSFNYKDHHKIVKLISPTHGLISVFMSYANKRKSKFAALAEPLTLVNLTLKEPITSENDLYYLIHGNTQHSFFQLKSNYVAILKLLPLFDILLKGDIDESHLPFTYRLLKSVLEAVELDENVLEKVALFFKCRMLTLQGIGPVINHCTTCKKTTHIVTASIYHGGLICNYCFKKEEIIIPPEEISLWRAFFLTDFSRLISSPIVKEDLINIDRWISGYYEFYTGIVFKSYDL